MRANILDVCILSLVAGAVSADPLYHFPAHSPQQPLTVIYQGPRVIAASPFYQKLASLPAPAAITPALLRQDEAARNQLTQPVTDEDRFPLHSTALVPGAPAIQIIEQLYRPFFVLGMDPASLAWLDTHARQLAQKGAFGLVVEAGDWTAWQSLKRAAARQGIALSLMPGDALASVYGIRSYPTLFLGEN